MRVHKHPWRRILLAVESRQDGMFFVRAGCVILLIAAACFYGGFAEFVRAHEDPVLTEKSGAVDNGTVAAVDSYDPNIDEPAKEIHVDWSADNIYSTHPCVTIRATFESSDYFKDTHNPEWGIALSGPATLSRAAAFLVVQKSSTGTGSGPTMSQSETSVPLLQGVRGGTAWQAFTVPAVATTEGSAGKGHPRLAVTFQTLFVRGCQVGRIGVRAATGNILKLPFFDSPVAFIGDADPNTPLIKGLDNTENGTYHVSVHDTESLISVSNSTPKGMTQSTPDDFTQMFAWDIKSGTAYNNPPPYVAWSDGRNKKDQDWHSMIGGIYIAVGIAVAVIALQVILVGRRRKRTGTPAVTPPPTTPPPPSPPAS